MTATVVALARPYLQLVAYRDSGTGRPRWSSAGEREFLQIRVTKGQIVAIRLAVPHALAIARLVVRAA